MAHFDWNVGKKKFWNKKIPENFIEKLSLECKTPQMRKELLKILGIKEEKNKVNSKELSDSYECLSMNFNIKKIFFFLLKIFFFKKSIKIFSYLNS